MHTQAALTSTKLTHSDSYDLLHTHQRHGARARHSHTHTVRRLLRPGRGRGGLGLSANLDSLGCLGLWDSSDADSKGQLVEKEEGTYCDDTQAPKDSDGPTVAAQSTTLG